MIPDWIMDVSFWGAVGAIIVAGVIAVFLAGFGLHMLAFEPLRKDLADPESAQVPDGAYRLVELREFIDALWLKVYGRVIDDFQIVRIDRALGRATVGEFRVKVMREFPDRGFRDPEMFLALARAAAIDAELSRSGKLHPADLIEFQKIADQEPAHRP